MNSIQTQLQTLRQKIQSVAKSANRNPNHIKLIAVSKKKSSSKILEALSAQQMDFGENYVQELVEKAESLKQNQIHWHFIGHLQKNKIKFLLDHISLLHTLDRFSLAEALEQKLKQKNQNLNALLQIKISDDSQKTGCPLSQAQDFLKALNTFEHIQIQGLMMIGTRTNNQKLIRHEMQSLKNLMDDLNKKKIYKSSLTELSMGMSQDYEIAIQEGATYLRIGSEIFGPRDSSSPNLSFEEPGACANSKS